MDNRLDEEKKRVLVIDDDENYRKTLSDILGVKGYETLSAGTGTEGLSFLSHGPVNIAIIDLQLPDMSGTDVLNGLKGASPSTEAIILTGNATLDSAIEATNRGAFSYLLKPCDVEQLLLQISRAIDRQQAGERIMRQNAELQMVNSELKALYEVSTYLSSTLDIETLFHEILGKITDIGIFAVRRKGCIFVANCEGIRLAAHVGMDSEVIDRCSRIRSGECLCGKAAATGEVIVSADSCLDERHTIRYEGMASHGHIIVPLRTVEVTVGVLCLYIAPDTEVDQRILRLLSTLGNQIGTAVANAKLYEETKSFSLHDPLTGLGNRRLLQIHMEKDIGSAQRYGNRFSVLMVDIDHFKEYNDAYGHAEGDRLLVRLSNVLVREVRCADWVFRYGGEEFLIVLPDTAMTEAVEAGERLRKAAEEQAGVTISIGVAEYAGQQDDREALIGRADNAMYRAKQNGRNRVEAYIEETTAG